MLELMFPFYRSEQVHAIELRCVDNAALGGQSYAGQNWSKLRRQELANSTLGRGQR